MNEEYKKANDLEKKQVINTCKNICKSKLAEFIACVLPLFTILVLLSLIVSVVFWLEAGVTKTYLLRPAFKDYEKEIMRELYYYDYVNHCYDLRIQPKDYDMDYFNQNYKNTKNIQFISSPFLLFTSENVDDYDEVREEMELVFNEYYDSIDGQAKKYSNRGTFILVITIIVLVITLAISCFTYKVYLNKKLKKYEEGEYKISYVKLYSRLRELHRSGTRYFLEVKMGEKNEIVKTIRCTKEIYDMYSLERTAFISKLYDESGFWDEFDIFIMPDIEDKE